MFYNPFGNESEETKKRLAPILAALAAGAYLVGVVAAMVLQVG